MPKEQECKKILFNLGIKLGVSPKLIATRLLSNDDKNDMLSGLLPDTALECHVSVWRDNRMPRQENGSGDVYSPKLDLPMQRYRGVGKSG